MAGPNEFIKDKTLHTFALSIFLIIPLMIGIYFLLIDNEKLKADPNKLSICLLGSYIGVNAVVKFAHYRFHERMNKSYT